MADPVEHPTHYTSHPSGVECITITQWMSFNVGNAVKYLWRAGLKGEGKTLEDLRKARQYIDFEIARLKTLEDLRKARQYIDFEIARLTAINP